MCVWLILVSSSYPQGVVQSLGRTLAEVELVGELLLLLARLGGYAVGPVLLSSILRFPCVLWTCNLVLVLLLCDTHRHHIIIHILLTQWQNMPFIDGLNYHL